MSELHKLTPREREVYNLLIAGLLNKQMAYELGISSRTIEVHRARVFRKLGVSNAVGLVRQLLPVAVVAP